MMPHQGLAIRDLLDDIAGIAVYFFVGDSVPLAVGNPAGMKAPRAIVNGQHRA